MEELVSVIVPMYNSEKYIYETIKSVIIQTYDNIEIVIVDDGSSDKSAEVVRNIIKEYNHKNIKYYYQQNSGVSVARNNGIKKSNGKYIAFIDSDDLWIETKIERQIEMMKKSEMKVCYCGYINFIENRNVIQKIKMNFIKGKILFDVLKDKTGGWTGTWVITRQFILDNEIWFTEKCDWGEDTEFYIKICALTEVCCVNDYLALYRIREDSLTTSKSYLKKIEEIGIWMRLVEWMDANSNKLIYTEIKAIKNLLLEFRIPNTLTKHIYTFLKNSDEDTIRDNYYKIEEKLNNDYIKHFIFNNGLKTIRIYIKLLIINYKLLKYRKKLI